jgi:Domain of unknown function (DUF4249)
MKKQRLLYYVLFVAAWGCKDKYDLPYSGPNKGHLVVDGFINSGTGPTSIRLSRTLGLVDTLVRRNEVGAVVSVEGKDNSSYVLSEKGQGLYGTDQLGLQLSVQYRLHIKTKDGKDYFSDYLNVIKTPAIDTISWERPGEGVELFVNTHDPQNKTLYYRWEFDETWEYHSLHYSLMQYVYNIAGDPVKVEDRPPESARKLFYCWKTESNTNILIGSSANLSRDSIHLPLKIIPNTDWRLSVLYSILVKQHAISAEHYEFLKRMRKNTEQTGSVFDAQPSALNGNIHNLADANEIVVGFIGISDLQEKRTFIKNSDVPGWNYTQVCDVKIARYKSELKDHKYDIPLEVYELGMRGDTVSISVGPAFCTDCAYRGSNQKPSFWP